MNIGMQLGDMLKVHLSRSKCIQENKWAVVKLMLRKIQQH